MLVSFESVSSVKEQALWLSFTRSQAGSGKNGFVSYEYLCKNQQLIEYVVGVHRLQPSFLPHVLHSFFFFAWSYVFSLIRCSNVMY